MTESFIHDAQDPTGIRAFGQTLAGRLRTGTVVALVGPLGAGGPDGIADHSFTNIQSIADSFASQQE